MKRLIFFCPSYFAPGNFQKISLICIPLLEINAEEVQLATAFKDFLKTLIREVKY